MNSKLHIAVNCRVLGQSREGIGWYNFEVVNYWLENHPEVEWTLIFDKEVDFFKGMAKKVILTPKTTHTPSIAYWNEVSVTAWLRKHKPDIYFSPDGFIPTRSNVPCFTVVHDVAPFIHPQFMRWRDYIYYRLFQKRMVQRADHVFTVSEFSKNEIASCFGISKNKITVGYNGLHSGFDPNLQTTLPSDIPVNYFLYYGSIHPRKNVVGVLRSFESYKRLGGSASLVLVGRKAWKSEEVFQQIQSSEFVDQIQYYSYLDNHILQEVLRKCNALLYISHYEGFGMPVLEAMATGVPVITTKASAMEEVGGDAVLCVNPLDHDTIGKKMKQLEADPRLVQLMIDRGHSRVQLFNYFKTSEIILSQLKESIDVSQ